jgi:hypothetical protein
MMLVAASPSPRAERSAGMLNAALRVRITLYLSSPKSLPVARLMK